LNPDETFNVYVQDMLRGPVLRSMPFFNQDKVVALLDRLQGMDAGERTAWDQILMPIVSMCVLHEGFALEA
jgi:asparagine synthase (glutamine-hydrolysing)